jgi:hypothetical protein
MALYYDDLRDSTHLKTPNLYQGNSTSLYGINQPTTNTPDYLKKFSTMDFGADLTKQRSEETGTLWDFFGSFITGGIRGVTFGGVRLGTDPEYGPKNG